MLSLDRQTVEAARRDVGVFAEVLAGEPLWDHQLQVARSTARIRCVCSGRQAGKTRDLAIEALFVAYTKANARVLVLSSGEDSAKDLLAEISNLSKAPWLAASVSDDNKSMIVLTNGSSIRCVPASEKQVRGKSIDLLILDEAAYIDDEIWRAARYTILARPGSRVLMASTPRGRRDRFFARHYHLAKNGPTEEAGVTLESFHWPSSVSPLVDTDLIEFWRKTDDPRIFEREVLANWVDEAGQWFTAEELDQNVAPFELIVPGKARGMLVVGGIDWGATVDSNALAVIGVIGDGDLNGRRDESLFGVVYAEERNGSMNDWARYVAKACDPKAGGFEMKSLASEINGCGSAPTEILQQSLRDRDLRSWLCKPVFTTNARKQTGFGLIKLLLQRNALVLPRLTGLRRQLEALEYETTPAGSVTISVPSSKGHDDIAMALMQATSCVVHTGHWAGHPGPAVLGSGDVVATPAGVRLLERPRLAYHPAAFRSPRGDEDSEKGW